MTGREALFERLTALRRRMLALGSAAGLVWAIAASLVLWLALVWLDLLWELSPAGRETANLLALAAGAVLWIVVFVRLWRRSRHALVAARVDRAGATGGQIVAGYELSQPGPQRSDLAAGLAAMAVNRAAQLAAAVAPEKTADSRVLRTPAAGLSALVAALLFAAVCMPRLVETEWLRFFDPHGDHPPYSRVQFDVRPGDAKVLYGAGLDVVASTEGPPVEQVELMLAADENEQGEPLAMFHQPDGTWRAVLSNVTAPGTYYVRSGRSRSARFALDVITVPTIEQVRFHVTPPAYTRRAAYEGPLPQNGLVGLAGTAVQVWVKSNRPLAGGTLNIAGESPTPVALKPTTSDGHEATGTFALSANGKFEIRVQDTAGITSQDAFVGGITVTADQRPLVRVIEPVAQALATPDATLPVVIAGEDDYGIARTQLYRSLNDSRGLAMDFEVPQPAATRYGPTQPLPLSAYGLNPGDVIKLYARIEDSDPAGGKGSESPLCEVHIISQREFEEMVRAREGLEMLMSKYQQADRQLEALAEERDGLRKKLQEETGEKLSDAARELLEKMAEKMQRDAAANREALEHLLPYDLDAALAERLAKLAESLEAEGAKAAKAADLATNGSLTREQLLKLLDEMEEQLAAEREEFADEAIEPLEHLAALFPLIEDQSRFVELYGRQRDLAERLASLKNRDGDDDPRLKARMRDLEAEQQRLRAALVELLADIEDHAMKLPEDERLDDMRATALEFADNARASGAADAMSEAEAALAEFAGTRGHEAAAKAADILESLIARCQTMGGKGRMCLKFQPSLSKGLGNTIEQLLAEMGHGDGGNGSGNGSSARRNTGSNVGLYGRLPSTGAYARSGNRRGPGGPGRGDGTRPLDQDDTTNLVDAPSHVRASGATGASVPAAYRRRVGAYFQRLVEERPAR